MESILGLCCAQSVPQRMLRWHYRSRHHSLIAVSNHEFYDDRLFVIPSPGEPLPGKGLVFHNVPDATFDRGGSATNRVEARAVARAVMDHARDWPNDSLGVGAFSVAQRDAILDELELLRRNNPEFERFFITDTAEPFFVKNLENIQGDERDVIFISVGYGKDGSGYMAMNFGPLSNDGGERRLNVLITRSRDCCAVFSSITAADIDLTRARARGAQALKSFLKYAESGLLDTGAPTGRVHDSEFERQVAKAIESQGFEIHPQVGVAGFFVDLAVVDPDAPGRYLLGIECDGASYHGSRSARDRDRLREAVLRDRGWIIHRVWSTDWFHRPDDELRKVLSAIEGAKIEWAARGSNKEDNVTAPAYDQVRIVRSVSGNGDSGADAPLLAKPYVMASFPVDSLHEIHQVPPPELANIVVKIIQIEGPVHGEEIARRVTQLWGLDRTGRRIRQAVDDALSIVRRDAGIVRDGDFYSHQECPDAVVRDRSEVTSPTLKTPDMLPPPEIQRALLSIVENHLGVSRDEAIVKVARLFGFRSTSAQLRDTIERELETMLTEQQIDDRNDKLDVPSSMPL